MVRMFTTNQNKMRASLLQLTKEAGREPAIEELKFEPVELKSTSTQTLGELWAQLQVTHTPLEKELIDKL